GIEICRCVGSANPTHPSVELPAWMFDRVHCAGMRLASRPTVAVSALLDLRRLIRETASARVVKAPRSPQTAGNLPYGNRHDDQTLSASPTTKSLRDKQSSCSLESSAAHGSEGPSQTTARDAAKPLGPEAHQG